MAGGSYLDPETMRQLGMIPPVMADQSLIPTQAEAWAEPPPDMLARPMGAEAPKSKSKLRPETLQQLGVPAGAKPIASPAVSAIPVAPKGLQMSGMAIKPAVDVSADVASEQKSTEARATQVTNSGAEMNKAVQAGIDQAVTANVAQEQGKIIQREQAKEVMKAADEAHTGLVSSQPGSVDDRKYFKDIGVGGTIGVILAAALVGGLRAKAGMNPDANPVVSAVQERVAQSIQSQRDAINQKREDRAQGLRYYERKYERAEDQTNALSADVFELGARRSELNAQRLKGTAQEQAALADAAALRQESQRYIAKLRESAAEQKQYSFARPPPGATKKPLTQVELLAQEKAGRDRIALQKTGRTFEENDARSKEERDRAALKTKQQMKGPNEQEARVSAAEESLARFANTMSIGLNDKGQYEVKDKAHSALMIASSNLPAAQSFGHQGLIDKENAEQATGRAFTGAGMPQTEVEQAMRSVGGGQLTPTGLAYAIESMRVRLSGMRKPKPNYSDPELSDDISGNEVQ